MNIKSALFLFSAMLVLSFLSCNEDEDPPQIFPSVAGGDWEIFQLAKIYVEDIPVEDNSFSGSIRDVDISLGRIQGDTLVFIIPNVGEGPAELTVNMGRQIRTYNLVLEYWPHYVDQKTFLSERLKNNSELRAKIEKVDRLKELADPFGQWIEFFNQKQAGLSEMDKEYLSGALQHGINNRFYFNPNENFELECINGPTSTLSSMTYKFVAFDNTYLTDYESLPPNAIHEAVMAGLGLSFWFQKILLEYYAHLTLECPQLRGFELIDTTSGEVISPQETLILESNQSVKFGHNGIFKPLTNEDISEDGPFYLLGIGFRDKEKASRFFAEMVEKYSDANKWELPLLNPSSLILPPNDAPTTKGPIQQLEWYYYSLTDNPNIRLVSFDSDEEAFTIKLESRDGNPQSFNLSISIWTNSLGFDAEIPAMLEVTCPILMDVLLIEKRHVLDIEFGALPYEISWSYGANGEISKDLPPGDYEVIVTDANGCVRTVQFTAPEFGTVEDIDGNIYETVKIGTTWWMAENLRTTRKRDGTALSLLSSNEEWISTQQPAYSWFENNQEFDETYGKLYNYYAACCNICPDGWKLPGIAEISSLQAIFGMNQGRSLRKVNAWPDGSLKSTNLSGLAFLPSGNRGGTDGSFQAGQPVATFWTGYRDFYGYTNLGLLQGTSDYLITTFSLSGRDGFSVRCVKE
jgi:uncharacterized protein (TIGR02145 family)